MRRQMIVMRQDESAFEMFLLSGVLSCYPIFVCCLDACLVFILCSQPPERTTFCRTARIHAIRQTRSSSWRKRTGA